MTEIAYNLSDYETEGFELVLGYIPGYREEELKNQHQYDDIEKFNVLYYKVAEKVFKEDGVFVTALTNKSRVLYPNCPEGGEKVYVIKGTRNPQFAEDKEKYKKAVNKVAQIMATELGQTTYSIVWRNEIYEYFYKK